VDGVVEAAHAAVQAAEPPQTASVASAHLVRTHLHLLCEPVGLLRAVRRRRVGVEEVGERVEQPLELLLVGDSPGH